MSGVGMIRVCYIGKYNRNYLRSERGECVQKKGRSNATIITAKGKNFELPSWTYFSVDQKRNARTNRTEI